MSVPPDDRRKVSALNGNALQRLLERRMLRPTRSRQENKQIRLRLRTTLNCMNWWKARAWVSHYHVYRIIHSNYSFDGFVYILVCQN